jgi:general secretion pathway protein J
MKNRKNSFTGFTLIEVLVTLTLLTIVLGALYSSFFSVQRATERFDNVSLKYHEVRTTLDIMRREIEGSLLKNPGEEDETKPKAAFLIKDRDIFGKNTSSLDFMSFSFKGSRLNAISYYVKAKEKILNLHKTEKPSVLESEGYAMEVIEEIEGFTVETRFNNKWVKTWDTANTDQLPEMVKISIEFNDNDKMVTLTEYARPRVGKQL